MGRDRARGARWGWLKSPEGTARERDIPLIGVADVSLRGLGSPEERNSYNVSRTL